MNGSGSNSLTNTDVVLVSLLVKCYDRFPLERMERIWEISFWYNTKIYISLDKDSMINIRDISYM